MDANEDDEPTARVTAEAYQEFENFFRNRGKFPGGGGRSQSLESMIQALDDSAPA